MTRNPDHRSAPVFSKSYLSGFALALACVCFPASGITQTAPLQPGNTSVKLDPTVVMNLQATAWEKGEARVIVGLRLPAPFRPEGSLDPGARSSQRIAIARAADQLESALALHDARIYHRYATLPALAISVDPDALEFLISSDFIDHIQADEAVPPSLGTSTGVVGAPAVWSQGIEGTGQAVVILDTGIDGDHAFFEDGAGDSRIVAEACFSNAGGAGGQTSLCPDGTPTQTGLGASEVKIASCLRSNGSQLCNHGVHVAGIAAGRGSSFRGVAPDADIISVQVFTRFNSGCPGDNNPCVLSYTGDQLAALDHVFNNLHGSHNVASVNMSLGGGSFTSPCDSDLRKPAIDNLRSVGIATVVATGNGGSRNAIGAPSCISTAIAVSSTTNNDNVSSFSDVHEMMDLFAPGSGITSSIAGGGFASFNGTSMATPHVAGAWAILKQTNPNASVSEILDALASTGPLVTDQRSSGSVTKPRIQIDDALGALGDTVWLGTADGNWNTAANWSTGSPPNCGSHVLISAGATHDPIISANAAANNLVIEDSASLNVTAGILDLCGNLSAQGSATFNMSGGTLRLSGSGEASIELPPLGSVVHHVQIGTGSAPKQLNLASSLTVTGDFTISEQAILNANGHGLSFSGTEQALSASGGAMQTIYEANFDDLTGWTVVDANADGFSWFASTSTAAPNSPDSGQHARYSWNTNNTTPADDWLFSPAISLVAGNTYTVSFNHGVRSATWPESLAVYVGQSAAIPAMTTQLFDEPSIVNTSWQQGSGTFVAPATGSYHLGFHANSPADRWELAVDDIEITTAGSARFADIQVASTTILSLSAGAPIIIDGDLIIDGNLDVNGVDLAVNGTVSNSGRLFDMRDVPAATTTHLAGIPNEAASAWAYRGVEITPTSSALGMTSVMIEGGQDCNLPDGGPLFQRCFDIEPTAHEEASLRFWLSEAERNGQDAAAAVAFRHDGAEWTVASSTASHVRSETEPACTSIDGNQCWVEAVAVTDYSPFVIGDPTFGGSPQQYTVGGTLSGLAAGNEVVLQNNGSDDLAVSADGGFTFATALDDGESYVVTVLTQPTSPNQVCTVANGSGELAGANVTNIAVTCSTETYTIGGTVSGLASGNEIVLQNNGGDDLLVSANGAFNFTTAIDDGESYSVSVASIDGSTLQSCAVANGEGTLGGGDVDDVAVTCTTLADELFGDRFETAP